MKKIKLLEFYLFEWQVIILKAASETSKIDERILPFLPLTLRELKALQMKMMVRMVNR